MSGTGGPSVPGPAGAGPARPRRAARRRDPLPAAARRSRGRCGARAPPAAGNAGTRPWSDVEAEVDHVPVTDEVVLPFQPQGATLTAGRERARLHEVEE